MSTRLLGASDRCQIKAVSQTAPSCRQERRFRRFFKPNWYGALSYSRANGMIDHSEAETINPIRVVRAVTRRRRSARWASSRAA